MSADCLILGQGLAGTLLAWEFERAGISFAMADPEPESAVSRIAAGMVNPITGRRLVKSWRIDSLLPASRSTFQELGAALGIPVWRDLRVRRLFADDRERRAADEKFRSGELAPFVAQAPDRAGFWIEGAARVELAAMLGAARERWKKQGRWHEGRVDLLAESERHTVVVDCTGAAGARSKSFELVPWEFSKGEILEITVEGLAPDVVLNDGHWVLPIAPGTAWVGATHEPKFADARPSAKGREALETAAAGLLQRPFSVARHFAGVRVNLPDKRPVAGRHPRNPRVGLVNGLGAKGVLWAPMLARQWMNHLTEGVEFDPEISIARFVRKNRPL
jgi:glycine/D-amino acid oxidase-like deaminating enzyme